MKEDKKFKIWKFKKYKLDKYKSVGLFNLLNINKKEKKELVNLKITIKEFFKALIYFLTVISIMFMFITIEKELYTVFDGNLQWLKNIINFFFINFILLISKLIILLLKILIYKLSNIRIFKLIKKNTFLDNFYIYKFNLLK